ncbi:uncharacterized protein [Clytia hemisphaerica]
MKKKVCFKTPKNTVQELREENGGVLNFTNPAKLPRNRTQVYNASKGLDKPKHRNTGRVKNTDFSKLLMMLSGGRFVKKVHYDTNPEEHVNPKVFAGTDSTLGYINTFCRTSNPKSQLGIDMTYKCGPFYVTPCTLKHPAVVLEDDPTKHPTVVAALAITYRKETEDYSFLAEGIRTTTPNKLIYGTDGEVAIEKAFESAFPITETADASIHLRCFNHIDNDIGRFLKSKLPNNEIRTIVNDILGYEDAHGTRFEGLVDAQEEEFEQKYDLMKKRWPDYFVNWVETATGRSRPLKETMKKCMLRNVRESAGLGNPPNKYSNNPVEAINLVVQEAISKNAVDVISFLDKVERQVFKAQEDDLIQAIYNMGIYRLACPEKSVRISEWNKMSNAQQDATIKKLLSGAAPNRSHKFKGAILLTLNEACQLADLPISTLEKPWTDAEFIIAQGRVEKLVSGVTSISGYDSNAIVGINGKCDCSEFGFKGLCCHVIAFHAYNDTLNRFLEEFKVDPAKVVNVPKRGGKKPHEKKKRHGKNNIKSHPITHLKTDFDPQVDEEKEMDFKEFWHNNEPFTIHRLGNEECKRAVKCEQCRMHFPTGKKVKIGSDIVVKHREYYYRPNPDGGPPILTYVLARKFYCAKRKCILQRFPYFWKGMMSIDPVDEKALFPEHFKILYREFHCQGGVTNVDKASDKVQDGASDESSMSE